MVPEGGLLHRTLFKVAALGHEAAATTPVGVTAAAAAIVLATRSTPPQQGQKWQWFRVFWVSAPRLLGRGNALAGVWYASNSMVTW